MTIEELNRVAISARDLIERKQYPQALKILNPAIDQTPDDAELRYLRGKANAGWQAFSEAEVDLKTAIRLEPNEVKCYLELGHVYADQALYDQASIEFSRAKHIAPNDLDVQIADAFMLVMQGRLDEALSLLATLEQKHKGNEKIANIMASALKEKATKDWHIEESDKETILYALSSKHVETAEPLYQQILAIEPQTEYVQSHAADLLEAISVAKKRQYQGGFFSWVIPVLLLVIGMTSGGFLGWMYAISAITFFYANWRPQYIINFNLYHNKDERNFIDKAMGFIDGDWMFFSNSIGGVLLQKAKYLIFFNAFSTFLKSIFLPITVFSSLRKNYGLKQAGTFVALIIGVGVVSTGVNNYQQYLRQSKIDTFYTAIDDAELSEISALSAEYPDIIRRYQRDFILRSVRSNQPQVFDLLLKEHGVQMTPQIGLNYYQYAEQQQAAKMLKHLSSYKPSATVAPATNGSVPTTNNAATTFASIVASQSHSAVNILTTDQLENTNILADVALKNPGFERDRLPQAGWQYGVVDWDGRQHGAVIPPPIMFSADAGTEGKQMAFLASAGSWMSQTLPIQPIKGQRYVVKALAGLRREANFNPGYFELQLYAGDQLLASQRYTTPQQGTLVEIQLGIEIADEITKAGNLKVRMNNVDTRQVNFDHVQLATTASLVAEVPVENFAQDQSTQASPQSQLQPKQQQAQTQSQLQSQLQSQRQEPSKPKLEPQNEVEAAPVKTAPATTQQPTPITGKITVPDYAHIKVVPVDSNSPIPNEVKVMWAKGFYIEIHEDGRFWFNPDDPGPYFDTGTNTWTRQDDLLILKLDQATYTFNMSESGFQAKQLATTFDNELKAFKMTLRQLEKGAR